MAGIKKKKDPKRATEMNSAASPAETMQQPGGNTGNTLELWGSFPAPVLGLLIRLREQLMCCEGIERSAPEPTVCIMRLITENPNYIPGLSLTC